MSRKPENVFIAAVHKRLPNTHCEKMCNPYRSGTADVWYSGNVGDLWVEYKYIDHVPRSNDITPDLTPRQRRWINARYDDGRNVAVILGTPDGGVIYRHKEWDRSLNTAQVLDRIVSKAEISKWILNTVGVSKCLSKE